MKSIISSLMGYWRYLYCFVLGKLLYNKLVVTKVYRKTKTADDTMRCHLLFYYDFN